MTWRDTACIWDSFQRSGTGRFRRAWSGKASLSGYTENAFIREAGEGLHNKGADSTRRVSMPSDRSMLRLVSSIMMELVYPCEYALTICIVSWYPR